MGSAAISGYYVFLWLRAKPITEREREYVRSNEWTRRNVRRRLNSNFVVCSCVILRSGMIISDDQLLAYIYRLCLQYARRYIGSRAFDKDCSIYYS